MASIPGYQVGQKPVGKMSSRGDDLQNMMINAIYENNQHPSAQSEQMLLSAQQQLAQFNAEGPNAKRNYADNAMAGNIAPRQEAPPATKQERPKPTPRENVDRPWWKPNYEGNKGPAVQGRTPYNPGAARAWTPEYEAPAPHPVNESNVNYLPPGAADALKKPFESRHWGPPGSPDNQEFAAQYPPGGVSPGMDEAVAMTDMNHPPVNMSADDAAFAEQEAMQIMNQWQTGQTAPAGNAPPTPPGSPSMQNAQRASQHPVGQGHQDPFLDGMALDSGPQQQAEMAAVYDKARLAQEAAYNNRLNPFGAGSGYSDLQRSRAR